MNAGRTQVVFFSPLTGGSRDKCVPKVNVIEGDSALLIMRCCARANDVGLWSVLATEAG